MIALVSLVAVASARFFMHSSFDLEIAVKSEQETKYHDFMLPLMQSMVNDRNLTSLRALHPYLNPSRHSRANGILFEFPSRDAWLSFSDSFHLHFLSLSTWWKNWRTTTWEAQNVAGHNGPTLKRDTAEGKYYYIYQLEFSARPGQQQAAENAVGVMFSKVLGGLVASGTFVDAGYQKSEGDSQATHRVVFEFTTMKAAAAFGGANTEFGAFVGAGANSANGFFASYARDLIIAPAPVSLEAAQAAAEAAQAAQAAKDKAA